MKKLLTVMTAFCLLFLLGGCAEEEKVETPVPTIQVAQGVYQYDQGYINAEGWKFDMTISEERQVTELNRLTGSVRLELTDEEFVMHSGYLLVWYDAEGKKTDELLVLSEDEASREGMIYEMTGADELIRWLNALELDEQNVTE